MTPPCGCSTRRAPVAATTAANRWGSDPTRLLRVMPTEPLAPGGWYTLRLGAGAETLDGQTTGAPWAFQVACETDDDPACPDLGALPEAHIDGLPDAPARHRRRRPARGGRLRLRHRRGAGPGGRAAARRARLRSGATRRGPRRRTPGAPALSPRDRRPLPNRRCPMGVQIETSQAGDGQTFPQRGQRVTCTTPAP